MLFIELKSARGRLSQTQRQWLEALQQVQHPPYAAVWRPSDLDHALAFLQRLAQEGREGLRTVERHHPWR
jgi:hypothetical protein